MLELILEVVVLVGLAIYLLVNSEPTRDVARIVTGCAAALLAVVILL